MEQKNGFFDGPPKTMFVFGLVAGVALSGAVSYLFNGSIPSNSGSAQAANQPAQVADAGNQGAAQAPAAAVPEPDADEDHVRGDLKKAKVVLIEYSDFQCPFCERHHPTLQAIADKYGDDVAWVYRHFPLTSIHPVAQKAAEASECAAEQDLFWEYGDALFAGGTSALTLPSLTTTAENLGMNVADFESCLNSGKYTAKVQQQQTDGAAAGVTGTPATFINGQLLPGAVPQAQIEQMIESML